MSHSFGFVVSNFPTASFQLPEHQYDDVMIEWEGGDEWLIAGTLWSALCTNVFQWTVLRLSKQGYQHSQQFATFPNNSEFCSHSCVFETRNSRYRLKHKVGWINIVVEDLRTFEFWTLRKVTQSSFCYILQKFPVVANFQINQVLSKSEIFWGQSEILWKMKARFPRTQKTYKQKPDLNITSKWFESYTLKLEKNKKNGKSIILTILSFLGFSWKDLRFKCFCFCSLRVMFFSQSFSSRITSVTEKSIYPSCNDVFWTSCQEVVGHQHFQRTAATPQSKSQREMEICCVQESKYQFPCFLSLPDPNGSRLLCVQKQKFSFLVQPKLISVSTYVV